jgi:hypothetical protein
VHGVSITTPHGRAQLTQHIARGSGETQRLFRLRNAYYITPLTLLRSAADLAPGAAQPAGGGHSPGRAPTVMSHRPFPSWNRSILTEIYLRHACSCHEIESRRFHFGIGLRFPYVTPGLVTQLRMETPGQALPGVWAHGHRRRPPHHRRHGVASCLLLSGRPCMTSLASCPHVSAPECLRTGGVRKLPALCSRFAGDCPRCGDPRRPNNHESMAQAGRALTVADYFESRYRRLRFPHLCCLQVGDPAKVCPARDAIFLRRCARHLPATVSGVVIHGAPIRYGMRPGRRPRCCAGARRHS